MFKPLATMFTATALTALLVVQMPWMQSTPAVTTVPTSIVYVYEDRLIPSPLCAEDEELFASIVMAEVGHETDEEIVGVAECLWNAMRKDGLTVEEAHYKYLYAGFMKPSLRVTALCQSVVRGEINVLNDPDILFFYGFRWTESIWHEKQVFVAEYGGTRFFKTRGR